MSQTSSQPAHRDAGTSAKTMAILRQFARSYMPVGNNLGVVLN